MFSLQKKMMWLLLLLSWFLLLSLGCEDNRSLEEKAKECAATGTCVITLLYDSDGKVTEGKRDCRFDKASTLTCGDCQQQKKNEQGQVTEKTCRVCNLCEDDFQCFTDSTCKGTTPYCIEGQCAQCKGNSDCEGSKKLCENNLCVECRNDQDCPTNELPNCSEGICVACKCSGQEKPHCLKASDQTVSCVECLESSHCSGNTPLCDKKTNACAPGCTSDDDCSNGKTCDQGLCIECRRNSDCLDPRKPVCSEGLCQCAQDGDCPLRYRFCIDKSCHECRESKDCPKGFPECSEGVCSLKRCTQDQDCTIPEYDQCKHLGREKVCVGCIKNEDCPDKKTCNLSSFICEEIK